MGLHVRLDLQPGVGSSQEERALFSGEYCLLFYPDHLFNDRPDIQPVKTDRIPETRKAGHPVHPIQTVKNTKNSQKNKFFRSEAPINFN